MLKVCSSISAKKSRPCRKKDLPTTSFVGTTLHPLSCTNLLKTSNYPIYTVLLMTADYPGGLELQRISH